jgi:hypothetical protein
VGVRIVVLKKIEHQYSNLEGSSLPRTQFLMLAIGTWAWQTLSAARLRQMKQILRAVRISPGTSWLERS